VKILHLFSNHKLTGPAAPAVTLAAELMKRGHEVIFAHTPLPTPADGYIDKFAAAAGLNTTTAFELPKHLVFSTLVLDAFKLRRFIRANSFDIVHCHLLNDHLTASCAALWSNVKIVRTNHEAAPLRKTLRNMFLFPKHADALIELSRAALDADSANFRMPRERMCIIDSAIDIERFNPARKLPDMRAKWGLRSDDFVVGIAARIQARRRFDVLLDAVALALRDIPNLKLVIIGRGTEIEKVAVLPARERGLSEQVIFAGYLRGDEYVGGLAALDAKIFMMPGTDGSCRAAREAMSLARPVIAAKRGMLPELVEDGRTGRVVVDTPENLAGAIVELGRDEGMRIAMGSAARETALERFDPAKQAGRVEEFYMKLFK